MGGSTIFTSPGFDTLVRPSETIQHPQSDWFSSPCMTCNCKNTNPLAMRSSMLGIMHSSLLCEDIPSLQCFLLYYLGIQLTNDVVNLRIPIAPYAAREMIRGSVQSHRTILTIDSVLGTTNIVYERYMAHIPLMKLKLKPFHRFPSENNLGRINQNTTMSL